jgi:Uma2 family endonuclease
MPVTLHALPLRNESAYPPHKRWTREECAALERAGLVELHRYELIEGELIQKVGKHYRHMRALLLVCNWLRRVFGDLFVVQESSIDVAPQDNTASEPEPDAIVLARSFLELSTRARPEEIRLLVEVADSTLTFDLTGKAALYARALIPEYWVLDINSRRLIVHLDPSEGHYRSIQAYSEAESLSPRAAPSESVRAADLL